MGSGSGSHARAYERTDGRRVLMGTKELIRIRLLLWAVNYYCFK